MTCACMLPQAGGRRMTRKARKARQTRKAAKKQRGGYRPTRRNRVMYKKYKAGGSIGFTGRASLKAKGILPRSNGRYVLGPKYSGTGKEKVLRGSTL
jgi:hypothetical protein